MRRIWVQRLSTILGSLVLGSAIAACGELDRNMPEATAPPSEEPAAIAEDAPTTEAAPSAALPQEEIAPAPEDAPTLQSGLEIGELTLEEIQGMGGGCGMTLWNATNISQQPGEQGYLLNNGLDEDSMLMKINGSIVRFQRTDFSGEAFYGQYSSQTFQNSEQDIEVSANVVLGEPGEIESVSIAEGTLRIEMNGAMQELAVVGDAGC